MKVKFSNGITVTDQDGTKNRPFMVAASKAVTVERHARGGHSVRGVRILSVDGKPLDG